MTITRREILKYVSAAGAAAALPLATGCAAEAEPEELGSGATRDELRRTLYPPFAAATPLGFTGQLRNAASERTYAARVDGWLPPKIRGTLYRNGPGMYERGGVRKRAIVDGDGMIRKYEFRDGRVTFQNRFVRTPKFLAEAAAGRYTHDTWTTDVDRDAESPRGHNAGVTPVVHDGKLYALDEVEVPYVLDPRTLATRGKAANFSYGQGWDFKAHTRKDPARGEWICWANQFSPSGLRTSHHVFDGAGRRVHSREVDMPLPGYMHDFFVTDDYVVYYNQPALVQPQLIDVVGFAPSLAWVPGAGAHLVIVPRRGSGAPIVIPTEARWMWHAANAYQKRGTIIADYIGYDAPDHFLFLDAGSDPAFYAYMEGRAGALAEPGRVRRMVIDLARKTVEHDVLFDGNCEFPVVSRATHGRAHRFVHFLQARGSSRWWNTVVSLNTRTGRARSYTFGAGHWLAEPVHVPDPDREANEFDHGFLLVPVYEEKRGASSLAVLRTSAIEDGPIARVVLEEHDPFAFHGTWHAG